MATLSDAATPRRPVVGVVAPDDLIERILEVGAGMAAAGVLDFELAGISYADELEIPRALQRVQSDLDACLFAGPLPHDLAQESGVLDVPATSIPLSGSALFGTLLRAKLELGVDVGRVSIDSVPEREVREAYSDVRLPSDGVRVYEYRDPGSPAEFLDFHREQWRSGTTTLALTSVRTVAQRLESESVPVLLMRPTTATIRLAVRTAALLGIGSRLEEAQIVVGIVKLPADTPAGPGRNELRLAVHTVLLKEARRMGATVLPDGEDGFYVIATYGSLVTATNDLTEQPFVRRVREELGLAIEIGIGLGSTAQAAEADARKALTRPGASLPRSALLRSGRPDARQVLREDKRAKALVTLEKLARAAGAGGDAPLVVDAGTVAELLDMTPRAARRVLLNLIEQGLAWQLPPARSTGPGRPRQTYRLLVEQLHAS
ncbi:transcriptional regulator [Thermoactinospora rubra]|uniref:transcriptional regulator n=1 Tax=Thermoactinospora rubra TaxID=1088767 RepID=UPI00117CC58F|nr:transcriptional regulator [Thermoactinospora rubra]